MESCTLRTCGGDARYTPFANPRFWLDAFQGQNPVGIQEIIAPTLRPGDTVIMDNCNAHKSSDACKAKAIHQRQAEIPFLPAWSSDFNPITMWSKVRQRLRGIKPRTREEVTVAAIEQFLFEIAR